MRLWVLCGCALSIRSFESKRIVAGERQARFGGMIWKTLSGWDGLGRRIFSQRCHLLNNGSVPSSCFEYVYQLYSEVSRV
jgi:hypothetical protein